VLSLLPLDGGRNYCPDFARLLLSHFFFAIPCGKLSIQLLALSVGYGLSRNAPAKMSLEYKIVDMNDN